MDVTDEHCSVLYSKLFFFSILQFLLGLGWQVSYPCPIEDGCFQPLSFTITEPMKVSALSTAFVSGHYNDVSVRSEGMSGHFLNFMQMRGALGARR
jgi:hypothetical protein